MYDLKSHLMLLPNYGIIIKHVVVTHQLLVPLTTAKQPTKITSLTLLASASTHSLFEHSNACVNYKVHSLTHSIVATSLR